MIAEVLRRMADIPLAQRGCQMRTVVSFAAPDGTAFQAEGIDRGIIAERASARRISGFPFRSLFFHPVHGAITADALAAGVSADDVMTHRRDAVAKLLPKLRTWFLSKEQ
jgi:inosine/xanthosine triphosphate pyrophosphatase family protein